MSGLVFFRDNVFRHMGGIRCFVFCISDNVTSSPGFAIGNLRNIGNQVFSPIFQKSCSPGECRAIFSGKKLNIIDELAECDFGEFENKNYQELDGNEHYQSWIDSGGLLPFPGGESREEFKRRNVTGFQKAVNGCLRNGISLAALVVHGGTIMNVMEEYADEDRSFYDWHVQNGKGYEVEIDPELWKKGRKFLHVIREL